MDIPADSSSVTLRFWWRTSGGSGAGNSQANASLEIQVHNSSGDLLETLGTLNENGPVNWTQSPAFDLSQYAGRRVRITFRASASRQSDFGYFDLDDVELESSTALCCDFNSDGKIDIADIQMAAADWGKANPRYDFNKNDRVDVADLMFVAHNLTSK